MAWDTKYRPPTYDSVIGQDGHVAVLREFVRSGTGFEQSYLFCGPWGSGKTTLGRILARALLCEDPQRGNPCDQCSSCKQVLRTGSSDAFVEFDAATNSGKEDIQKIVESLQYATFSGRRRIYLIDESHRLSKQALDALLKVMEDNIPGSDEKWLICIFCTTEPDNMRETVFSRCAPAFTIRKCSPEVVANRLAWICDQETVEYDQETLELVASIKKCHFRDAIKAVETIAKFGAITRENTSRVLNLDVYPAFMTILEKLGQDEEAVQGAVDQLIQTRSPAGIYQVLGEMFMMAYRSALGIASAPSYLDAEAMKAAGVFHGSYLVAFSNHFGSRPSKVTESMLRCDLAFLHHMRAGNQLAPRQVQAVLSPPATQQAQLAETPPPPDPGKVIRPRTRNVGGVHVDDRAVNRNPQGSRDEQQHRRSAPRGLLTPQLFRQFLEDNLGDVEPDGKGQPR